MEHLFLECAIRAALLVAGTALVLYVMRVKAAPARHSVWKSVVLLMLGLPIWTIWGPKAPLYVLPPLPQFIANGAALSATTHLTAFGPSSIALNWQSALVGVYLLGLGLLLLRLAIGTVRARRLVREAMLHHGVRSSSLCVVPVTVGFFHPTVILPDHWRDWPEAQLDAVLTHEREHARRHDSLVQWVALLNRSLFWFHPLAWWLERHLSALAEESCDNVVLEHGHRPQAYSEYLIDMARSVTRSGARLNVAGMAMPGSFLPQRVRQIMKGLPVPRPSRARMACVAAACAITGTAFTAGTLDHVRQNDFAQSQQDSSAIPVGKRYVLGDLKIKGDVQDREGVSDRILRAWNGREYDDAEKLAGEVMEVGIRADFQDRGYFRVVVEDPVLQPLDISGGKQRILLIASISEGDQFRFGALTIRKVPTDQTLSIAATTLREQFHLHVGDLFKVSEVRAGLVKMLNLYGAKGYEAAKVEPDINIDDTRHLINLTIRVTEGVRTR